MIALAELQASAERYGVPIEQIERDHFISHVLAALGSGPPAEGSELVFFGGTALCRTWLPDLRLSEDIDLLVNTNEVGADLRRSISRHVRREYLNHEWTGLGAEHGVDTWNISADGVIVKVQFALWRHGWKEAIPTTSSQVKLRYSDLPDSVEITVPTGAGFAAMKLLAWLDRFAPRDIYDLAALAQAGYLDATSLEAAKKILGHKPTATMVRNVPMENVRAAWDTELLHQIENPRSLDDCVSLVTEALAPGNL